MMPGGSRPKQQKTTLEPRQISRKPSPPPGKLSDISGDLAVADTPTSSQQEVADSNPNDDSMGVPSPDIPPTPHDPPHHNLLTCYDPFVPPRVQESPLVKIELLLDPPDDTQAVLLGQGKRLEKGRSGGYADEWDSWHQADSTGV